MRVKLLRVSTNGVLHGTTSQVDHVHGGMVEFLTLGLTWVTFKKDAQYSNIIGGFLIMTSKMDGLYYYNKLDDN